MDEDLRPSLDELRYSYGSLRPVYERFAPMLETLAQKICSSHQIEVESISSRAKEVNSLVEKFERHPEYRGLVDVPDMCGVRIITYYVDDVALVRDALREEFDVIEEQSRGSEAPDSFGYRSLHMLVRISTSRSRLLEWREFNGLVAEFQLRTVLQHAWAVISHTLDYKTSEQVPVGSRRKLFRVAALLETGDELFGDFRQEVVHVREEYRQVTTAEAWQSLSLDLESVLTAWSRLPTSVVVKSALDAGFVEAEETDDDALLRRAVGNLVTVAAQAQISTVGDLARYMSDVPRRIPQLRRLAQEATAQGFTPVADASDVLTICLVLDNPNLRVVGSLPFRQEVERALDSVQPRL